MVFSFDEKTQCQKRNGTIDLCAARIIATGDVVMGHGVCPPGPHRQRRLGAVQRLRFDLEGESRPRGAPLAALRTTPGRSLAHTHGGM